MGATLDCTDVKMGSYWYLSRTNEFGRYYPSKVTLDQGINTTFWSSKFESAITFPSEFAIHNFAKKRNWYGDKVEIVHIHRGAMRGMTRIA